MRFFSVFKIFFFLIFLLLNTVLVSPVIMAEESAPSATSTPSETITPTTAKTSNDTKKEQVLGKTKKLGSTSSGKEIAKWTIAGMIGFLVVMAGVKVTRMHVEE